MSEHRETRAPTRVLVTGSRAGSVLTILGDRQDLQLLDERTLDLSQLPPVDLLLHTAAEEERIEHDLLALREFTQAPVILAVPSVLNGMLEDALRFGVKDVLILPQPAETIVFAIRKVVSIVDQVARDGRIVTVASPKGGTGKTAIATNLAAAIARSGKRVLLIDLDLQFGDAAVMLGVDNTRTIVDLAATSSELDREKLVAFAVVDEHSGVAVIPGPHRPEEAESLRDAELTRLLTIARSSYDAVVIDTAPIFDRAMLLALDVSDDVLVVCNPEIPSLKNTKVGLETIERLGVPAERVSLILNRVGGPAAFGRSEVEHTLGVSVRFMLPDDPAVPNAINRLTAAVVSHPQSPFSKAIVEVATAVFDSDMSAAPAPARRRFRIGSPR